MNVQAVMAELATTLDTIPGLRVYAYVPKTVAVPAAIVAWPEAVEYDATMGRGSDIFRIPVLVVVSDVTARNAPTRLGEYVNGSGAKSVKAVLEAHAPTNYDALRVKSARMEPMTVGTVDYLAATFDLDIIGPGA